MANIQMLKQTANQFATDQGAYQKAVNQFNFDADVYNKQLNEYKAIVADYDAKAQAYNTNVYEPYMASVNAYNASVPEYNKKLQDAQARVDIAGQHFASIMNQSGGPGPAFYQGGGPQAQKELKAAHDALANLKASAPVSPTQPAAFTEQKPGDFTAIKPELTATAPKSPGFTKVQLDALSGKQSVAQQERNKDSGLVAGAQAALQDAKSEGSMIGGLLARARYST